MTSKWIRFEETKDTEKTKCWNIVTKEEGYLLGEIKWFSAWRKYSFFPLGSGVFEVNCLIDIVNFITAQMDARKRF